MVKAESVDEYIARFPHEVQEVLQTVRETIRAALPHDAGERISYAIPAFTVDGKVVAFYAGWKKHISLYPVPTGTEAFQRRIAPYVTGRGTASFSLSTPMPLKLITEITRARLRDHRDAEAQAALKATAKKAATKTAPTKKQG